MAEVGPSGVLGDAPTIIDEEEADINLNIKLTGVINRWEVQHHKPLIEDALWDFRKRIEMGIIKDIMRQLVEEIKQIIIHMYPTMEEADIVVLLWVIPNCTCLAMWPQTSEVEGMLEELMPKQDIPNSGRMAAESSNIHLLMYDQKDMIVSLFDDISVTHKHLARAARTMSNLCKVLDPQQLMLIMQNAVQPLIQLNVSPGMFNPPAKKEWKELPDDHAERVHDTMIPDPKEKTFMKETHYNIMRLLAATVMFYVDHTFSKTCMMKEVQERFIVCTKPLSLCITGRKYQGGLEWKAQLKRKRKSVPLETARKEPDEEEDNSMRQQVKDRPHWEAPPAWSYS